MLRVIVESASVKIKKGISDRTGKPYQIREQEVFVFLFDAFGVEKKYPSSTRVVLEDAEPYAPGEYTISPDCFYLGKYDQLMIGRITLKPRPVAGVKSAAA